MLTIIAIVVIGMLCGFLFRKKRALIKAVNVLMNAAIYILLLLLGISVGSNPLIMQHIGSIGAKALEIAFAAVTGSIVVGYLFHHFAFRGKINEE